MPQLENPWIASQLFWLFVCFAALYLVLSRVILPPLQGVISTRKNTIENDLNLAQELKAQAEQAKQSYENTLIKSRAEAQKILSDAEATAKLRTDEAKKALETQISIQLTNATAAINAKKQELLKEIMPSTAELSKLIVEKLIEQTPSPEQIKRSVDLAVSSKT